MINSLGINNFKSLKEEHVVLKGLNILSGVNGSGKSSLCQALLLIQKFVKSASSFKKKSNFSINHIDFSLGKVIDVLFEESDEDKIQFKFNCSMKGNNKNFLFDLCADDKDMDYLKINKTNAEEHFPEIAELFDKIMYLKADRVGPKVIQRKDDEKVLEQGTIGSSGEYTYSFLDKYGQNILKNNLNRSHIESSDDSLVEQVSCWLGEISTGINIKTKELDGTNLFNLSYTYSTKIGESNNYRTTNVGFGITYCLPVILLCLIAQQGDIKDEDSYTPYSKIYNPKLDEDGMFDHWPDGFFDEWMITNKELLELRDNK